jgi:pyruvate, water dikinase
VTYSDINNTVMLIEIARQQGNYVPDLSFGTHFFQDLVEASIRYLPLYPDDEEVVFNEAFLRGSRNLLSELLPDYAAYSDTVTVIDVPANTGGNVLRILMNAELEQAVAYFATPTITAEEPRENTHAPSMIISDHWEWRLRMAERIAASIDAKYFGIRALYLFGSTKNGSAGPASDIDLLVHIEQSATRRKELERWFEGWGICLAELNYLRTGYRSDSLLDIHYVTDDDIAKQTSYAMKIDAVTDAARMLRLTRKE